MSSPHPTTLLVPPTLPTTLPVPSLCVPNGNKEASTSFLAPPPSLVRPPSLQLPSILATPAESKPHGLTKSPPMICEQGPSAPSSPTSPGGSRLRRPSPLTADAMQRISLLTAGFDFGKLSPISPSYPTSDLGSSPRSSISVTSNQLGPWTAYRDHHRSSFDLDDGASDVGNHNLLSPNVVFSPAPFSPFSDCLSGTESPYSTYARSPNLSPNPSTKSLNHFSFDQIRSSSSMSNRHAHLLVPSPSFDLDLRERSRSDSDMAPKEEKMDISQHSTISVPATTSRSSGQYKKRLLQKYEEQERKRYRTTKRSTSSPPLSGTGSDVDDADLRSVSRQQTLDDETGQTSLTETSSATTVLSFHRVDSEPSIPIVKSAPSIPEAVASMLQGQQQIEEWMQRQLNALHAATIYNQVVSSMLKNQLPKEGVTPAANPKHAKAFETEDTIGPVRTGSLWKGAARGVSPMAPPQPLAAPAPAKDSSQTGGLQAESVVAGPYVCTSCGQAFSLHDRLAKHIASRHRERSATEDGNKTHKCTVCNKSFGRSDMLTRHMRLHTGSKPYSCPTCGQVFSRSDHLSTHLRTHTGEKPYACSLCSYTASRRDMISRHMRTHIGGDTANIDISGTIASLSLSPCVSPLPPASVPSSPIPPTPLSTSPMASPMQHLLTVFNGSLEGAPASSTNSLGSGERSAFHSRSPSSSHLLVPPAPGFHHSLSSPASPTIVHHPNGGESLRHTSNGELIPPAP